MITSDHALRLDHVPPSAVILGGGVIGVEFASVWRSFGAEVTIVEALPHLLPPEDESSSKLLERAFRRRGIKFELGARFEGVKETDAGVTRDPGERQDDRGRAAAGRRRPRAGLRRASATRRPGSRWTAASSGRRVLPDQRADDLRGRRPDPRPAAGPRRVRRGHPGRRAARRAAGHARSTTTACRGSPTATPRSPRSASPRRPPPSAASRPPSSPTTSPATARADPADRGRGQGDRRDATRRPARCSASTWSAPGSAS